MHFYDFFDALCANKGVTIPEAYTAMKINKGTVSKWKTARDAKELVVPSSKIAIKMAKYFSLDASLFLREDGNFEFEQKETPATETGDGLSDEERKFIEWLRNKASEKDKALVRMIVEGDK